GECGERRERGVFCCVTSAWNSRRCPSARCIVGARPSPEEPPPPHAGRTRSLSPLPARAREPRAGEPPEPEPPLPPFAMQPASAKWYDRRDYVFIEFCVEDSKDVNVNFEKSKLTFR
ncbi:prostaglandin E synthase 3, partial [Chelydra serpentina]